jgi:hypothetical protein
MNNYKKYLKYKYKYYALKKQIGGGKVAITSLTVYDPPRRKKERQNKEQEYNKVRKDFIPYSWADILKNLTVDKEFKIILPNSSNELTEANISTILNNHTGFIIETNGDILNGDIKPFKGFSGNDRDSLIININFETQNTYTFMNVFNKSPVMNTKYINTILNSNKSFNNRLKEILMEPHKHKPK